MSSDSHKRKVIKILESLSNQIDKAGLSDKININYSTDPYYDLENAHQKIINYLLTTEEGGDTQIIKNNECVVLDCLKFFINIHLQVSKFSKILYETEFPLQVYKAYRRLYEQISITSNCLYQYESDDRQFLKQKEQLITQNLQICQQIQFQNSESAEQKYNKDRDKSKDGKSQFKPSNDDKGMLENLRKENDMLNQLIRQNDQQFSLEIQRYNNTLFDMQQTIRQYQVRMDKIREYQAIIDDLQHKVIRLKQQKYRDDMLIDNMSKKIRFYQKQRGGADAFLSPRANQSRKQVISPSSRLFNQSMFGSHATQMKAKNYYGQRLTSN